MFAVFWCAIIEFTCTRNEIVLQVLIAVSLYTFYYYICETFKHTAVVLYIY